LSDQHECVTAIVPSSDGKTKQAKHNLLFFYFLMVIAGKLEWPTLKLYGLRQSVK